MTALCSGKICTIFPEKGALNFWKACTIALEYSIIKEIFILDEIPFALIRNGHMETKMPISQIFHDDLELIAWIEKEEKANVKRIKDNIHDAKELVELMYSVIEDCEFMPVADLNDKKIAIKERAKEIFDVKI